MYIQYDKLPDDIIAGTTLKDDTLTLSGNLALHTGDDPEMIITNREKLAADLKLPANRFVFANQTHSKNAHLVTTSDLGRGSRDTTSAIDDVDAVYTYEKNAVIGVFTADCVPVLFYDERTDLIGAIHSGWKGTVQDIVSQTFVQIKAADEDFYMGSVKAILGPSISQTSFEVDQDVADQFKALGYADDFIKWDETRGKFLVDNQATVIEQLKRVGFLADNIRPSDQDTYVMADGFSYRLDKTKGRHFNFIARV